MLAPAVTIAVPFPDSGGMCEHMPYVAERVGGVEGLGKELTEALIVNPYDLDEASSALDTALRMSPEEQQERMHAMRTLLAEYNVYRWAGRMLIDAARLRGKDRLTGRLSDHLMASELSAW